MGLRFHYGVGPIRISHGIPKAADDQDATLVIGLIAAFVGFWIVVAVSPLVLLGVAVFAWRRGTTAPRLLAVACAAGAVAAGVGVLPIEYRWASRNVTNVPSPAQARTAVTGKSSVAFRMPDERGQTLPETKSAIMKAYHADDDSDIDVEFPDGTFQGLDVTRDIVESNWKTCETLPVPAPRSTRQRHHRHPYQQGGVRALSGCAA